MPPGHRAASAAPPGHRAASAVGMLRRLRSRDAALPGRWPRGADGARVLWMLAAAAVASCREEEPCRYRWVLAAVGPMNHEEEEIARRWRHRRRTRRWRRVTEEETVRGIVVSFSIVLANRGGSGRATQGW